MTTPQTESAQAPEQRDYARRLAAFRAEIGPAMADALNRGVLADQAERAAAIAPRRALLPEANEEE